MRLIVASIYVLVSVVVGACYQGVPLGADTDADPTAPADSASSTTTGGGGPGGTTAPIPEGCGNGVVEGEEACDDENEDQTDDCNRCQQARCGDAEVWAGVEECDDGNLINIDSCRGDCFINVCGDGQVNQGVEVCDDGNDIDDDNCSNTCEIPTCRNGMIDPGEQCDDNNDNDNDACTNACTMAVCGDGITQNGVEQCDDGNSANDDDCLPSCVTATCGDSIIRTGVETCDDGNALSYDGCSAGCAIESFCYNISAANCPSGLTQYCTTAEAACDNPNAALVACDACMGPENACAIDIVGCTDGLIAIDQDACPAAVAFGYVNATGCNAGDVTDCDGMVIAGVAWCTAI